MIDHVSTGSPSLRNIRSKSFDGAMSERVRVTVTDDSVLSMSMSHCERGWITEHAAVQERGMTEVEEVVDHQLVVDVHLQ